MDSFLCTHTKRPGNAVAHALARFADIVLNKIPCNNTRPDININQRISERNVTLEATSRLEVVIVRRREFCCRRRHVLGRRRWLAAGRNVAKGGEESTDTDGSSWFETCGSDLGLGEDVGRLGKD
ncbi:hypothetical protein U1Q18_023220 [Sarracenia purpurea var. burkii]